MPELRIDSARLWQTLNQMAAIGATSDGGCNRQALTPEDGQGRDLFVDWCRDLGLSVRVDRVGNIFARKHGTDPSAPAVLTGSHLDTQPTGGRYDGVLGVLAGLEALRTLAGAGVSHRAPIDLVVWTNEEGARFTPAMVGSGVWAGVFDEAYALARTDKEGVSLSEALAATGYNGDQRAAAHPVAAAFELHIEQGPILEQEGKALGVVSGVQGIRWYDLRLTGVPCHAGPSPMEGRRDPFMALAPIVNRLYKLAESYGPWSRVTFGDIQATPGARNTVPEQLHLCIDLRHPDNAKLTAMDALTREIIAEECQRFAIDFSLDLHWDSPAVEFDADCVARVQAAAEATGQPWMRLFSGAGHDSVYVARKAPTAMIFIPCLKGLSHNAAESITEEQAALGAQVLCDVLLASAR